MAALLLSAVGGTGRETGLLPLLVPGILGEGERTYVALSADHLVAVELGGEGLEGGLDDTTTETEDQMEGRLLRTLSALFFIISFIPIPKPASRSLRHIPIPFRSSISVPFGCCNRSRCGHPPIACQQRSSAVGPGEFPPCPGSCS